VGILYWEVSVFRDGVVTYRRTFETEDIAIIDYERLVRLVGRANVSFLTVSAL
jgi:hypothetical protein